MAVEIERKFLVADHGWKSSIARSVRIRDGLVERKLDELTASYRNLRQEEITAEIIELSAGTLASTDSVAHERPQVEAQA
jgi:CYTH domain-containing protein